ncbi:MAG: beta galactosidase jelly roll domain-containing protein [Treponema sp.]|jgi:beta-mannosidase|nr:beta galactosidase jelly roll domain-containing protein [Treponema sp.]
MRRILTISKWDAVQYNPDLPDHRIPAEKNGWFPVKVPGAIQYDLMALGKIENLYASTRAASGCAWVARSDWLYRGEFESPAEAASAETLILRFKGIDTFSELWLNGAFLGDTCNAMRVWDFPVKPGFLVPAGKNTLLVRVKAHHRMVADKAEEAKQRLKNGDEIEGTLGKSLIRRYQRSFFNGGSSLLNLGTGVLGIGINRNVELLVYPGARFSGFFYRTEKIESGGPAGALRSRGKLFFNVETAGETILKVTLSDAEGRTIASMERRLSGGEEEIPLDIEKPRLWWPASYGEPYLYRIRAELVRNGEITDELDRQIGIRTVELVKKDPEGRDTFYLKVNGRKLLIHGENHIPLDYIKCYASGEEYDRLFKLLKNQNVNLIRIWGGGVAEEDSFYDRCDRMGILIWQDMFLHSNTYPDYDPEFVENFMAEAEGIIRAMRPHPCLALICGGNEQQEGWDEWGWKGNLDRFYGERLFNELLPPLAAELCPDLPYIPNSPHGGIDCQSPAVGECHNWGNFYNSTKDPVFVTETCWTHESYSRPETLKKYMGLDADAPEWNSLGWPALWKERTHLGLHNRMPYSSWFSPESLRSYLHNLELEQFRADYSALSEYRYRSPSNNGVLYWSHNKGGPLFQFGCVDYGGYPLMSYYAVKRIFNPVGVYAYRDVSDIVVMLSNHTGGALSLRVEARHLDKQGRELGKWARDCRIEGGELLRAARLEDLYGKVRSRLEETIHVSARRDGETVAEDLLFFCPFREYEGEYRALSVKAEKKAPDRWRISLRAESPARLVELESNHKLLFTDNYFPLVNGGEKAVEAVLLERTGKEPVRLSAGILGAPDRQTIGLE